MLGIAVWTHNSIHDDTFSGHFYRHWSLLILKLQAQAQNTSRGKKEGRGELVVLKPPLSNLCAYRIH